MPKVEKTVKNGQGTAKERPKVEKNGQNTKIRNAPKVEKRLQKLKSASLKHNMKIERFFRVY
jgi:hypothetical protein